MADARGHGGGHGGQFITLYEAQQLMTTLLAEYERDVVEPRHKETQGSLSDIQRVIQRGAGAMWFAGVMGGVASVLWIVLQIRSAIH